MYSWFYYLQHYLGMYICVFNLYIIKNKGEKNISKAIFIFFCFRPTLITLIIDEFMIYE